MSSSSSAWPVLFQEDHIAYFHLEWSALTVKTLTKAYRKRVLIDHPDKGGETHVFQETKDMYDNMMRNLEVFECLKAQHPGLTIADVIRFTQQNAKKPRTENKPKITVAPPWHAKTILEEPFGNIEAALSWLAPYLASESLSSLAAQLRDLQIGQDHTTELFCAKPPAFNVAVKYHGTSWTGFKAIILEGFLPVFGAMAPADTPLVYTSGRARTAWRYPWALCDEHNTACGEVVANDTYCIRLCLTCNVDTNMRTVKIRRKRGNVQDAYPVHAIWATAITFRAMATAPPEQLAQRQPKADPAQSSSDDDKLGGVWHSPVDSGDEQPPARIGDPNPSSLKPPANTSPAEMRPVTPDTDSPSPTNESGNPAASTSQKKMQAAMIPLTPDTDSPSETNEPGGGKSPATPTNESGKPAASTSSKKKQAGMIPVTSDTDSPSETNEAGGGKSSATIPPWRTTEQGAQRMLMQLRFGPRDDRSQTQVALAIQSIMSVRQEFLLRHHLNDMAILAEEHRKAIWNEDMKEKFIDDMHDHDRRKKHSRYRAWVRLALGDVHVVKKILKEGMPPDIFAYIIDIIPPSWRQ